MPSKEKANAFRLLSLVTDEGTGSLRHLFDSNIPPDELQNKLNESAIRTKLGDLRNKNVITKKQWDTLYPQIRKPRSGDLVISLLNVLLRYICGLNEKSRLWTVGQPSSLDTSTEADISRIRMWRNEFAHMKELTLSEKRFEDGWRELEQAILRLGSGVPELAERIKGLGECTIDPEHEVRRTQELLCIKGDFESLKDDFHGTESRVSKLQENVKNVDKKVDENSKKIEYLMSTMNKTTTIPYEPEAQNHRNNELEVSVPDDQCIEKFVISGKYIIMYIEYNQFCELRQGRKLRVFSEYSQRQHEPPLVLGHGSRGIFVPADGKRSSVLTESYRLNEGRSYVAVVTFDEENVRYNLPSKPKRQMRNGKLNNQKKVVKLVLYKNGTKIKEAKLTQLEVNQLFNDYAQVVWELPTSSKEHFENMGALRMLQGFID